MTSRYEQAHRDRQLLLIEASAHRAVEMAAKIPGLNDEERRAIAAKLEVAKASSPRQESYNGPNRIGARWPR
jgi:hypothetical protein